MRAFRFRSSLKKWPPLVSSAFWPKACRPHKAPRRRREKTSGTQRIACVQTPAPPPPPPSEKIGERESLSPTFFFLGERASVNRLPNVFWEWKGQEKVWLTSNKYRITPQAHMSTAKPTGFSKIVSGAKYIGDPLPWQSTTSRPSVKQNNWRNFIVFETSILKNGKSRPFDARRCNNCYNYSLTITLNVTFDRLCNSKVCEFNDGWAVFRRLLS